MQNLKILSATLLNKTALLTVFLPSLCYLYLTQFVGLLVATVVLALYSIIVDLYFKIMGKFVYVLLAFSVMDLVISIWVSEQYLQTMLALKVQIYAGQSALVFLVFTQLKKPVPMLMAEAFAPALRNLKGQNAQGYIRVWQQVSTVWVIAFVAKAIVFHFSDGFSEATFALINSLAGWPLHIGLVYFAIAYSRNKFEQSDFAVRL